MFLPVAIAVNVVKRGVFMLLLYCLFLLIILEILKNRTGLKLTQQIYIDSLKYMKSRVSKEEYSVFFSMIIGISSIALFRHLYLPSLDFYLKFNKDLIPQDYSNENNQFLKMATKYGSILENNRNSIKETTFVIDWTTTIHVSIVWIVYLGFTESLIDLLEAIIPKTSPCILGIQILRIEYLYATLIDDPMNHIDVSALNLYVSPLSFLPFFKDKIPPEVVTILQDTVQELDFDTFIKLKRLYIKLSSPESQVDILDDAQVKIIFTPCDIFYIINRAYYQSINIINQQQDTIKNEMELKYYKINYPWPNKTEPLSRYNILVIGESGAGKSTLINAIYNYSKFNDPDSIFQNKTFPFINPSLEDFESDKDFLFTNLILVINKVVKEIFQEETLNKFGTNEKTNKTTEFYLSQLLQNSEPPVNEQDHSYVNDENYLVKRLSSIFEGKVLPDKKDQTKSVTQQCTVYPIYFNDKIIQLIDTPGLNDTEAGIKDALNLKIISDYLKGVLEIHFVLFVVNANITRVRNFVGDYLQLFDQSSLIQNNKPLFGYMFTHISQESIHTINSLTEAISLKIFKKDIKAPIFTCDNSILQTMKDRCKGKDNTMSQERFTALWNHNTNELLRCIDNITQSTLYTTSKSFAPESNGIVMFEYPFLATPNNSLYPFTEYTLNDFKNTPVNNIWENTLNKRNQIFDPNNLDFIQLFYIKAMRRVLFFISKDSLSEKSNNNEIRIEKRYLLWQIQQLQQLQLPNIPIENTFTNIFITQLNIVRYLASTVLKEQNLSPLITEINNYRKYIIKRDQKFIENIPIENLIPTEEIIQNCNTVISQLSSTSTSGVTSMIEKHSKIDLQRLGVWEMYKKPETVIESYTNYFRNWFK
jgi:GTPase SAR1 family protein